MNHPNYDAYWKAQNVLKDLKTVPADLPILNVAGWFDAEDFYGPMSIYYTLEKVHPRNRSILAVGPWLHGGWNSMPGDQLGHIKFGSETSRYFQSRPRRERPRDRIMVQVQSSWFPVIECRWSSLRRGSFHDHRGSSRARRGGGNGARGGACRRQ